MLSSRKAKKHHLYFIAFAFIIFVLATISYNQQAAVKVGPSNPAAEQLEQPTVESVAVKVYEAPSEKPVPPLGLPLEKLGVICDVPHDPHKMVALTFDDGPSDLTPAYLAVLRSKGVHATFFNIGLQVVRHPGLAAMIADSGNEIGNHTYSHLNLEKSPLPDDVSDILRGQEVIEQDSHQRPSLLRPPGGALNVPVIKKIQQLGYTIIYWNIDPQDWRTGATPEEIINNVMTNIRPGAIILMHEGKPQTLKALPELIDDIKKQGYEIGTVSELLGLPKPPLPSGPPAGTAASVYSAVSPEAPAGAAASVLVPYNTP